MVQPLIETGDFVLMVKQYSTPVYFSTKNTPKFDLHLACGNPWELGVNTLLGVPIPPWAESAFDADAAKSPLIVCVDNADQDNFMIIIDLTNNCEYALWQARNENGTWIASWANALPLNSTGIFERGLSSRDSGFGFLGGVIWPHELKKEKSTMPWPSIIPLQRQEHQCRLQQGQTAKQMLKAPFQKGLVCS